VRYTLTVRVIRLTDGRRRLRYFFGGMLCWLLLVYAVGAKLALYHPHRPGAQSVAATKAWQDNALPSVESVDIRPAASVLHIVAVLLSLVFVTIWCISLDEPAIPFENWFSPYLSVRPPPTL
jgi:hypothetical protein